MSREIKFRAWHKHNKKMIDLKALTPLALTSHMTDFDGLFIPFSDSLELMQYTGLKDRNGKEGYHKDIWLYHGVVYTIEWDDEESSFYLMHPSKNATDDDHIRMSALHLGEIIGNIYEQEDAANA